MEKHYHNLWKSWAAECGLEGVEPENGEPWVVGYGELMITGILDREGQVRLLSHLAPWPEGGDPETARRLLADNGLTSSPWPTRAYLDEEIGNLVLTTRAPAALLTEGDFTRFVEDFARRALELTAQIEKAAAEEPAPPDPSAPFPEGGLRL